MKKFRSNRHSVDFLFTISLFFVFTITALYVTIAGANLYEKTLKQTSQDYSTFTSLSYLEQKIQRYDSANGISVMHKDEQDILCLHEIIEGTAYTTYIYTQDGQLMELFLKDDGPPNLDTGTPLMNAGTLTLQENAPQTLTLDLTDENGLLQSLTVHLKAKEE